MESGSPKRDPWLIARSNSWRKIVLFRFAGTIISLIFSSEELKSSSGFCLLPWMVNTPLWDIDLLKWDLGRNAIGSCATGFLWISSLIRSNTYFEKKWWSDVGTEVRISSAALSNTLLLSEKAIFSLYLAGCRIKILPFFPFLWFSAAKKERPKDSLTSPAFVLGSHDAAQ